MTDATQNGSGHHAGGCLCGAVRYTLHQDPANIAICHCRMCQLWTGSPYFLCFTVPDDDIDWTGPVVQWRSSDIAVRAHCGTCGTPLYWRGDGKDGAYDVSLVTLDNPDGLRAEDQIWTSAALKWPGPVPGLPSYPEEDRDAPASSA